MIIPDVSDETVLVTGSAKGLGRELTLALARNGARTAVHFRSSESEAHRVADAANHAGAPATTIVQGDVTDPESVDEIFGSIESRLGPVSILINNVGDFAPDHWESLEFDDWNRVIETNLTATYLCTKRALPTMRDRNDGKIINIGYASSEKGLINPKNAPYFIAKAGVLMFTRMIAADTKNNGITVNAVSPYVIENSVTFPENLPRGRPARFEDITQAVFLFLDADSSYISGTNIEVDGGWLPEDV